MESFDPLPALAGGALIGLSAVLLLAASGRIAGISGILGGAIDGAGRDRDWRVAFLAGLVAAPLLLLPTGLVPDPSIATSAPLLLAAGLLVGVGTALGGGCTSGHGICGLARFSRRSLAATAVFMGVAGLVVFAVRHLA